MKATFFVLGNKAEVYPDIIKKIHNDGHQIGNHTYDHRLLRGLSDEEIREQIEKTNKIIKNIIGKEPTILRPGYGMYNNKVLRNSEMPIILWSIDSKDWRIRNSDRLFRNIINKIKDGDIILMHDIFERSIEVALMIIDDLQEKGFEFVTIERLAKIKGIELISDEKYFYFR